MSKREKETGGTAFPQSVSEYSGGGASSLDYDGASGMDLRDWFAGQALSVVDIDAAREAE